MNTEKASENYEYTPLVQYLEEEGSVKALKMLDKIKSMKTNGEFTSFKIDLKYKAMLDAF